MNIDWKAAADALESVSQFASSPLVTDLAALGGPSAVGVVKIVEGLAAVSGDLVQTAEDAAAAIQSGDLARIKAADAKLQLENADLSQKIADS